jgi:hypothetical protein
MMETVKVAVTSQGATCTIEVPYDAPIEDVINLVVIPALTFMTFSPETIRSGLEEYVSMYPSEQTDTT